jgi:hypothetical protein
VNGYEKSPGFAAANTIERGLVDILHWLVEMSSKQNPLVGWTLHIEMDVSIVPLLLAVVAGHKEEQRATHENRLPFPPCSCPFPE